MAKVKQKKSFDKVLIANRGEIACRIIFACKSVGIKTVAVYSDVDAGSRHVKLADEAVCIGAGPAAESYLNIKKILDAADKTGAQAIHPGYGFLSERAVFAKAVVDAGLVWIGPSADVIDRLGSKIEAKKIAEKAGVPTLPWALLPTGWAEAELITAAKRIGYPLLLKASAGGGGRGMRLVQKASELLEKATSASREALDAFGSGEMFLEKYTPVARHVEIQILGDQHGKVISFGERECSAQRRHQKVLEEAPAPNLSEKTRTKMAKAAVALAETVGYVNAGTCEFLVDEEEGFYFLEMNTRLQVEHPVTEWVWGVDLPVLQLKVAAGEKLSDAVLESKPRGHSIEARIYAEDPSKGFMPSPGVLTELYFPQMSNLRVDIGFLQGQEIPIYYDAMIAKVIAWGMDRDAALATLLEGLKQVRVGGVAWNGQYLIDILSHEQFKKGKITTAFLGEVFSTWKGSVRQESEATEVIAVEAPLSPWDVFGSTGGKLAGPKKSKRSGATNLTSEDMNADFNIDGPIVAEYPGKVLKVLVKTKDTIEKGQVLVVCESMKMEFSYSAKKSGKVGKVCVSENQIIAAGQVLIEWEN